MNEDFKSKTLTGITWSVVSQVGRQGIVIVIGIILARLLAPEQFGLIAMVTVITGFANLFSELGLGSAIIQKKDVQEEHLSSIFWINIFFGLILTLLFIVGAELVAQFYNEPILEFITIALAFNFIISSAAIVQQSLYTKAIDFKSLSIVEIGSSLFSGLIAIYMAFNGFGVWSLVAKSLLNSFFKACFLWIWSDWKPRVLFSWRHVNELLGFSLNLLGEKSLNYWVRSIDDILIGKVLGSFSLGLYTKAYQIMLFPLKNISSVISRVMFPSMSKIKEDRKRVGKLFLKITRVIALFTFPMMIGSIVIADDLVPALFGVGWERMIPILRVLCIVGLMQSVVTVVGSIFQSQGRSDKQFQLGLIIKPILISGIVIGLYWGVLGVAIGYACAVSFAQYMNIKWAGHLVGVRYSDMLSNLGSVILCSIGMGGLVLYISVIIPNNWSAWSSLIVQVIPGIIAYISIVHFGNVKPYNEAKNILMDRLAMPKK